MSRQLVLERAPASSVPFATGLKPASACEVAVIGAGPYGLATAAHLKAAGLSTRVFGDAMVFWRKNMPKGMLLRHASDISDPGMRFSLNNYMQQKKGTVHAQLPISDFIAYGEWFQRQAVPDLDRRKVTLVRSSEHGFRLRLEDGEMVEAKRVVIAMGLAKHEFKPSQFAGIEPALASHTCEHESLEHFRGRHVAVIGRGQSACESAVLLKEAGAKAALIARGPIHWVGSAMPGEAGRADPLRRLLKLLTPKIAVGPFPLSWLADTPGLMRRLPDRLRDWVGARCLRPGATAWLRPRSGGVRVHSGRTIVFAQAIGQQVMLGFDDGGSSLFDHILLATGYHVDIAKFGILADDLVSRVNRVEGSPVLSQGFESSVPGLHFIGSSAVQSFGPMMRFVLGTGYAARSVAQKALTDCRDVAISEPRRIAA